MTSRDKRLKSQIENPRIKVRDRRDALKQMARPSLPWLRRLIEDPNTPKQLLPDLQARLDAETAQQFARREAGANSRHQRTSTDRFLMKEYLRLRAKYPDEYIPIPILSDGTSVFRTGRRLVNCSTSGIQSPSEEGSRIVICKLAELNNKKNEYRRPYYENLVSVEIVIVG